jgi:methionyl-tRNA synthetase
MLIGADNVLYVCGTDDHGSTSELTAAVAGKTVQQLIAELHGKHSKTLSRYNMSLDVYSGTSAPETFPTHKALSQEFLRKLHKNGLLEKRTSKQWYDPKSQRFLQDRFVQGKCPNPKCENTRAYSDECEICGTRYEPSELIDPVSALPGGGTLELRDTVHWWLDMWQVAEVMRVWIEGKKDKWRPTVYNEVATTVSPTATIGSEHEPRYKEMKANLPKHKSRYAPGKKIALAFTSRSDMDAGREQLKAAGIATELFDAWAHRSITRDVKWGIPVPSDLDPDLEGKTLYVWPDSLIAPISFTQTALTKKGRPASEYKDFWCDPKARICQFLGADNVYFYVLMQGAMWIGTQPDITRLPKAGELQLTDIFGSCLLMVGGEKMSKSRGNFYNADELLDDRGYTADQVRYFLATLGLATTPSNFEFAAMDERNKFLAGPLNAAFEKPISACHSKFDGKVPDGVLNEKTVAETQKLVAMYFRSMDKGEYITLLGAIENYARQINSMFTQFKPHDDRHPEDERRNALYTCFYVLKNIMIMLYPFVPSTMETLRQSLRLPADVFRVEELATPIPAGHAVGEKAQYFPAVEGAVNR